MDPISYSTPVSSNGSKTHAGPTLAERAAERYRQAGLPSRPGMWAKVRPYLITGAVCLALGAGAMGVAAYRVMPLPATRIERVFADVNGDGIPDFIVSGDVVLAPKASAPVTP